MKIMRFVEKNNAPPARILIVDDLEDNRDLLGDLLSFKGYQVDAAMSGEAALERVQSFDPDLILLDVLMPGMNGYDVCASLKANGSTSDIPVIFVSSMADIESKVKGFEAGGVDYIEKPFQAAEVLVRVNTHLTLRQLRKRLEEKNAELERLANTDALTELFNRRRFFQEMESEFAGSMCHDRPFSLALIDVDRFKEVNDVYGHLVGDQVLAHIAGLIRSNGREKDITARYGGEEFVILLPETDCDSAYHVVEAIRDRVENTPFIHETDEIHVTLSAGIVDTLACCNCQSIDGVLAMADQALYRAKQAGRNTVVVFNHQIVSSIPV